VLKQTILHGHQTLTFRHHGQLRVVVGNAGGVRVSVKGRHSFRPGPSGQVRVITVR
jgi:Domain of unknown function (DUF4115)